ncbi:MAG: metallophosphoesterase [Lysobacter sp.]
MREFSFGPRAVALAARIAMLCLALLLPTSPVLAQTYRFDGVERVVAIGDVHGAYPELVEVLEGVGLVDGQLRWSGGKTHLVTTGDLLDRGDRPVEVVELLMRLQQESESAGGAVHVLLGNHEIMSLTGDLRYVTPGGFASFAQESPANAIATPAPVPTATAAPAPGPPALPPGFMPRLQALAPDGRLGRWLLQRPVMIVINGDVFVHGGLSARMAGLSLEQINRDAIRDVRAFAESWHALMAMGALQPGDDFDRILVVAKQSAAAPPAEDGTPSPLQAPAMAIVEAIKGLAFVPEGPVWYRGSAQCHPYMESPVLAPVLEGLQAQRVVIGHTPTLDHRIASRMDGQVLRIDTGMNRQSYHGQASALLIQGDRTTTWHAGDGGAAIRAEANREWQRPYDMSDAQIEEFLLNAAITTDEELDLGVTHPRRLTLERNGQRLRAVFKTLDTDPDIERRRWERSYDKADRYLYEVAAYRLDRILGLQMVPVAVPRTVDGQRGMLQYWVEDAVNETDRAQRKLGYGSDCDFHSQHALVNVFDMLINNVDRNTGNILYDRNWQVWLIDHGRSFGANDERPPELRDQQIVVTPPMAEALEAVTAESLEPLAPYLNRVQRRALMQRALKLRRMR